tara:strand:+ start:459 stop:779 length:321 start_codon:yes stop_codon:yes gene_type:complete
MIAIESINKKLVKAFVQECKEEQNWKERYKANFIEFDNYFKYSGRIEENKILISHWKYDHNHNCNDLHEKFIKVKEYEKNKKNASKLSKGPDSYYWYEAKNSVWGD